MSKWDLNHYFNLDRNAKNEVYFKIFSIIKTKRSFFGGKVKISCAVWWPKNKNETKNILSFILSQIS